MNVAQTILAQLGNRRFMAMTGAKNFVNGGDYLMFSIPTSKKINKVQIILDANDTYTVKFMSIRGVNVKEVSVHEGVYCDMLQDIFTSETGLYTSL